MSATPPAGRHDDLCRRRATGAARGEVARGSVGARFDHAGHLLSLARIRRPRFAENAASSPNRKREQDCSLARRESTEGGVPPAQSSCIPAAKREPGHRRRGDHVQPADHYRIPPLEEQPNEPLLGLGELVLVDQRESDAASPAPSRNVRRTSKPGRRRRARSLVDAALSATETRRESETEC